MKRKLLARNRVSARAFTLVELLVVMAIVGILAGIVLGMAGLAQGKAARTKALADLQQIQNALEEYRLNYGAYPETQVWKDMVETNLTALLREVEIEDPWGHTYDYERDSLYTYMLWSRGIDTNDSASADDVKASTDRF